MADFDEQQHRAAYEALGKGDTGPLFDRLSDDDVQHMTAWNLTVHGRGRTREMVDRVFERLQVSDYRLEQVLQHGDRSHGSTSGLPPPGLQGPRAS